MSHVSVQQCGSLISLDHCFFRKPRTTKRQQTAIYKALDTLIILVIKINSWLVSVFSSDLLTEKWYGDCMP